MTGQNFSLTSLKPLGLRKGSGGEGIILPLSDCDHLANREKIGHHFPYSCFIFIVSMRSLLLTLALLCLSSPAVAATCEESFQKKGDFLNGAAFSARVQVEGLSVEKAFAQLRPILARESIKTLSTDLTTGTLRAENPATAFQRALPIDVFASTEGTLLNVEMIFTLPSGVTARRETVKRYLCGALNQLVPPSTAATAPPAKTDVTAATGPAIEIEAKTLAKQVKEAADNPARIRLNFVGKTFRVSGKVLGIADQEGAYIVSFDGGQPVVGSASKEKPKPLAILCTMAKNQDATVAALQINQRATLVGRFQGVDHATNSIKLQDCL
jgi:tRNA_anti-like